jgi:hypothetical protein
VLLGSCPQDQGLQGRIWTGDTMREYLYNTYQVSCRSAIYDLLERLGLSHQKTHADYAHADPQQQKAFLAELTGTLLASDGKTATYGWAEKNTRPSFRTDEKKQTAPTGCRP